MAFRLPTQSFDPSPEEALPPTLEDAALSPAVESARAEDPPAPAPEVPVISAQTPQVRRPPSPDLAPAADAAPVPLPDPDPPSREVAPEPLRSDPVPMPGGLPSFAEMSLAWSILSPARRQDYFRKMGVPEADWDDKRAYPDLPEPLRRKIEAYQAQLWSAAPQEPEADPPEQHEPPFPHPGLNPKSSGADLGAAQYQRDAYPDMDCDGVAVGVVDDRRSAGMPMLLAGRPENWPDFMAWPRARDIILLKPVMNDEAKIAAYLADCQKQADLMQERARTLDAWLRGSPLASDLERAAKARALRKARDVEEREFLRGPLAKGPTPHNNIHWACLVAGNPNSHIATRSVTAWSHMTARTADGGVVVATKDYVNVRRATEESVRLMVQEMIARGYNHIDAQGSKAYCELVRKYAQLAGISASVQRTSELRLGALSPFRIPILRGTYDRPRLLDGGGGGWKAPISQAIDEIGLRMNLPGTIKQLSGTPPSVPLPDAEGATGPGAHTLAPAFAALQAQADAGRSVFVEPDREGPRMGDPGQPSPPSPSPV